MADEATATLRRDERSEGLVAHLEVSYPARLNVLNTPLLLALEERMQELDALARDGNLRVVVLSGAGERSFIGGADIYEMVTLDGEQGEAFITRIHRFCAALRALPVPVLARVGGHCLGAGLEVALSCDLRVASRNATFGMPEVKVGVPSVIEAALLPRFVGAGRARELVLTGRVLDAEEAARLGLVEQVVDAGELDAAVEHWLGHLLESAPGALAQQKELCRIWEEQPLTDAVTAGISRFAEACRGDERARYMRRFLDRKR